MEKVETIRNRLDSSFFNSDDERVVCPVGHELHSLSPTTVKELSTLLGNIATKSCMLDPLPGNIMKDCINTLLPTIARIVNLSFAEAMVPKKLKCAVLEPRIKKPLLDNELLSSYRPISNLRLISKVIEKVATDRLNCHLTSNDLHEPLQSAYKPGHSTETALVKVQNDILCSLDKNSCVILLLLDLSAAFDTVDHQILLARLSCRFGIKGKALTWFKSYLCERSQFVRVDTESSTCRDLPPYGVPQGSVLGPVLYLLYTAPLGDVLKRHDMSYHFYADDSQIYMSFQPLRPGEPEHSKSKVEACILDINKWMTANKLMLNNDKTELLVLNARHRPPPPLSSIYAGSELIIAAESAKNIGVWFDNTLSMNRQVNSLCKTAFYHLRNLATIRKFLSHKNCEILIHAFVTCRIDYCNSLLSGLPQHMLQKLQYVQNAAARLLTYSKKYDHITPILIELHWLPVKSRIEFKILILTFKAYYETGPKYLTDTIIKHLPTRKLRSATKELLVVPKYNLETYGKRAFSVIAPILWNNLPDHIRAISCLRTFKSRVKTFLFNRSF